tara:strand:+ start:261 stop:530 length:270 start_codon:yes stop_codon:yes gene_type:complete
MKMIIISFFNLNNFDKFMNLKFSWYVLNQLQDWIVSKKPYYPNLKECISWVKDKFKREGSNYHLTKEDLEDIEMAYEFQTSDIDKRSYY